MAVRSVLAVAALTAAAGCESESLPRASVSGVVYADGQELQSGVIRFVPINGTKGPIVTVPVAEGSFSLSAENGPVIGSHRVEVQATDFLGFDLGDQAAAEQAIRATAGRLPKSPVPAGYGERSPLTAEISPEGAEGLVFLLTSRATTERPRSGAAGFAAAR
ncbi:MAG: hypothetical protein WBC44_12775 [Planctomycetaceae bacterium]